MKKLIVLFAGLFLMTIAIENVNAQNQANTTAESSAYIVVPIAIAKNIDLYFGKIVPTATAGTVEVTPAGFRNFTNGALVFQNDLTFAPAKFTVTGEVDATYSIQVPESAFNVTRVGGAETMSVGTFVTNPTSTGVLTNGTQELFVGATISVGENQTAGLYKNTTALQITVAYN